MKKKKTVLALVREDYERQLLDEALEEDKRDVLMAKYCRILEMEKKLQESNTKTNFDIGAVFTFAGSVVTTAGAITLELLKHRHDIESIDRVTAWEQDGNCFTTTAGKEVSRRSFRK